MSKENVEHYRQGVDAYNRGDLEGFLAQMDPAVEFAARVAGIDGSVRGHAGVRSWWQDQTEALEDLHMDLESVLDRGDWVIATGTSRMRGAGSGVSLDVAFAHASVWHNGKCVSFQSFRTLDEAFEAAGLQE